MSPDHRPDKAALVSQLKGFQRLTVDHVMSRLFDSAGSRRFLVADEVGLGKTLIARGVVAEVIDRLWDNVGRVDILYVCSNTALASENLRKIHLGGKRIEATRLTLIPKQLPKFDPKLNFISLTPGTALRVTGYGRVDERVVLFALLSRKYGEPAWLKNLLEGDVETNTWRNWHLSELPEVDEKQTHRFLERLSGAKDLQDGLTWAEATLLRADSVLDHSERRRRYHLVEGLRRVLAFTCIDALEPDLIILDEFQRFKDLLGDNSGEDERSELAELASELFRYETPEGNRVATLLLSATPYRMYATDADLETGDHYADFLETLRFLCNDEVRFSSIKTRLNDYRLALQRASQGDASSILPARDHLETELKNVMVRTERVDSTAERDAMVEEAAVPTPVKKRDLVHYMATEQLAEQLGARDMVEFWKSAPYLFNFMKSYKVKEAFDANRHLKGVRHAFEQAAAEFLSEDQVQRYREVDPANARLRVLTEHSLGAEQWRMLWLPPTVPYWPLTEPWLSAPNFSKKLVFSAWNVVPDVVSALISYEAERRMVGSDAGFAYAELHQRQRPLLRYAAPGGRPTSMTILALSLPCLALADGFSPLKAAVAGQDVRQAARQYIDGLISELALHCRNDTPDPRWFWAAPLLFDRNDPTLGELLTGWNSAGDAADSEDQSDGDPEPQPRGALIAHIAEARALLANQIELGAFPVGLADTLIDLALGGPAVLVARSFLSKGVGPLARRKAGVLVANGFRSLFNQPAVTRMVRGSSDDDSYWRATLSYAVDGNLQAVLDEQVHLLWEQTAWDNSSADDVCADVAANLRDSVTTKVSRVSPDIYKPGERKVEQVTSTDQQGRPERLSLRTSFALRYGTVTGASGAIEAREESVRKAFKSPFFPFVLISTSVGQEGLDFHPWCHDIWHWNLPGNPVDLEQREGRVHRYKGLAIRKNVAEDAFATLRRAWNPGDDPWEALFQDAEAKHRTTHSELVPYWVAPGPHKVRRFVPCLPFSSEVEQFRRLKRSLAIYRVVFGQPRQQELLELLEDSDLTRESLEAWTISLRPDGVAPKSTDGASNHEAATSPLCLATLPQRLVR